MPTEMTIHFHECEHNGDLEMYQSALVRSGASILSAVCDPDSETGVIKVSFDNKEAFLAKFRETDAYHFSHLSW